MNVINEKKNLLESRIMKTFRILRGGKRAFVKNSVVVQGKNSMIIHSKENTYRG